MAPNQMGSNPRAMMAGIKIGTVIIIIGRASMKHPMRKCDLHGNQKREEEGELENKIDHSTVALYRP
jgi:hypothetical protein